MGRSEDHRETISAEVAARAIKVAARVATSGARVIGLALVAGPTTSHGGPSALSATRPSPTKGDAVGGAALDLAGADEESRRREDLMLPRVL